MTVVFATCSDQPFIAADDQPLADALRDLGHPAEPTPWTELDPYVNVGAEPIVLRSTWDYYRVPTMFSSWLEAIADSGRTIVNPAAIALGNVDKVYLKGLEGAGIPVPKSRWIERPDPDTIATILREERWENAVLKPRIGATAHGIVLVAADRGVTEDELVPARASGALIQEFIPEIRDRGEVSMVYAGGRFSHAVAKYAKAGDFRVQKDFGGLVEATTPSPALLAFGEAVMAQVPSSCVFARVDLVEGARGPLLLELELIEPELYFRIVPESAERMARAIVDRL